MTWRRWEAQDPAEVLDRIRAERSREARRQAQAAARLQAEAEREQARAAKLEARRAERLAAQRAAQCENPFGAICRHLARQEKRKRLSYLIQREGQGEN